MLEEIKVNAPFFEKGSADSSVRFTQKSGRFGMFLTAGTAAAITGLSGPASAANQFKPREPVIVQMKTGGIDQIFTDPRQYVRGHLSNASVDEAIRLATDMHASTQREIGLLSLRLEAMSEHLKAIEANMPFSYGELAETHPLPIGELASEEDWADQFSLAADKGEISEHFLFKARDLSHSNDPYVRSAACRVLVHGTAKDLEEVNAIHDVEENTSAKRIIAAALRSVAS